MIIYFDLLININPLTFQLYQIKVLSTNSSQFKIDYFNNLCVIVLKVHNSLILKTTKVLATANFHSYFHGTLLHNKKFKTNISLSVHRLV